MKTTTKARDLTVYDMDVSDDALTVTDSSRGWIAFDVQDGGSSGTVNLRRDDVVKVRDYLTELLGDTAPELDIVTREEAEKLPRGSIVRPYVDYDVDSPTWLPSHRGSEGWRMAGCLGCDNKLASYDWWQVLFRTPEPAEPLTVGDTVETQAQLEALPSGAVIRSKVGGRCVAEKDAGGWQVARAKLGVDVLVRHWLPAKVLDLLEEDQ